MHRLLEYQANQIEMVLASHRVPSRVSGGMVTPRFVQFQVQPALSTRLSHIQGLSEEIALSLGASSCRIYRQKGIINVEVPRLNSEVVKLLSLCQRLPKVPPCTAVLGIDEGGTPVLLRLTSPDVAHVLVAGTTGSGKTEFTRTMITSLAIYNRLGEAQLVLIDPKGRGFAPFEGLPHLLCPVIDDVTQAALTLTNLVQEMERRDRERVCEPRIVIFIDELADLMMAAGKTVDRAITRLTQRGREAGIHLVGCTQKPTAAVLGSLVKSNFPVRLVGSVPSPEDAKVASGLAGTGAERLLGRGDFLIVVKGRTIRLQVAYVSPQEITQVLGRLNQGNRKSRGWALEATGTDGPASGLIQRLQQRMAVQLRLVK